MRRPRITLAISLLTATSVLLATGFLYGTTPDDEEYRSAILSTFLHARGLLRGEYLTWTSQLGLGLPQPLGPSLFFHPLMPLLGALPVDLWVLGLLSVHLLIGTIGAWYLGKKLGLSPSGRAVCGATLLLSTPAQNYVLTDFWPTLFVSWTQVPWLLIGVLSLLDRRPDRQWLATAAATGLVGGLIVANGHAGYLLVYGPPLAGFLGWHWRSIARAPAPWIVVALVGGVIAAPTLYFLGTEFLAFPAGLPRDNYGTPLRLGSASDVLLRPFSNSLTEPFESTRQLGTRTLFFGGPFTLLALLGGWWAVRNRLRRDLAVGAGVALVMMLTPGLNRVPFFTATYLFRDPLILFGAPLAALMLDSLRAQDRTRRAAVALGCLQMVVLVLGAWPFLQDTWATRTWEHGPGRAITSGTPLTSTLSAAIAARPGRLYLSSGVSRLINGNRTRREGLVANSFAYLGVPVVNGRFKGVSVDALYPSPTLPYGAIGAPRSVQLTRDVLDLAAIRYVLTLDGEAVAPGLERQLTVNDSTGRSFTLWHNTTGEHRATVVDRSARSLVPITRADCTAPGLFCTDAAPLQSLKRPGVISTDDRDGRLTITLEPATAPRLLLVSEMFRPEWTVEPAGVEVTPAFNGLMFVDVPSGVTRVDLTFFPGIRLALSALAWTTIIGVGLAVTLSRARRGNQQ